MITPPATRHDSPVVTATFDGVKRQLTSRPHLRHGARSLTVLPFFFLSEIIRPAAYRATQKPRRKRRKT